MSKRSILVGAVLVVLLVLLALPYIQKLRVGHSRSYCQEHQRQLWQAMSFTTVKTANLDGEITDRPTLPAATLPSELPTPERLSWVVGLLPQFGSQQLAAGFRTDFAPRLGWADAINRPLGQQRLPVVLCPARPELHLIDDLAASQYVALGGLAPDGANQLTSSPRAGAFRFDHLTPLDSIRDSLSSTAILTETTQQIGGWIRAGSPTLRMLEIEQRPYLGVERQFGGLHPGGTIVFFADGSSRFLTDQTSSPVFQAMLTISGGPKELPGD